MDRNTVRDLGCVGSVPRYIAKDAQGRVFTHGGMPARNDLGWRAAGAGTPYLCMYDPLTDRLYQLAVLIEGPEPEAYAAPYVLIAGAEGKRLFGNAVGGKYLMEFDLTSIALGGDNPLANGSIVCRHAARVEPQGNQRTGVVGKDGRYYFVNSDLLFRYDPARRALDNLGRIDTAFGRHITPQGSAVAPDGTLYLKYIYPYQIIRFPRLTSPEGEG
jgi:hypothetical protein